MNYTFKVLDFLGNTTLTFVQNCPVRPVINFHCVLHDGIYYLINYESITETDTFLAVPTLFPPS